MQPPVLEGLGGRSSILLACWRAATQFLDTTSLVIGPATVVWAEQFAADPLVPHRGFS